MKREDYKQRVKELGYVVTDKNSRISISVPITEGDNTEVMAVHPKMLGHFFVSDHNPLLDDVAERDKLIKLTTDFAFTPIKER